MEDWDGAVQDLPDHPGPPPRLAERGEIVDIFYRLGNIKLKQGERKKALNMFEKALEIEATHRPTLQAVIDLQQQPSDWEAVIHAKRQLLPIAEEPEKVKLLDEIGDIYHEQAATTRRRRSPRTSRRSRCSRDNHVSCCTRCSISTPRPSSGRRRSRSSSASPTSRRIRSARGKYYHAAARICRDELKSTDDAIDYFNQALDQLLRDAREAHRARTSPST